MLLNNCTYQFIPCAPLGRCMIGHDSTLFQLMWCSNSTAPFGCDYMLMFWFKDLYATTYLNWGMTGGSIDQRFCLCGPRLDATFEALWMTARCRFAQVFGLL